MLPTVNLRDGYFMLYHMTSLVAVVGKTHLTQAYAQKKKKKHGGLDENPAGAEVFLQTEIWVQFSEKNQLLNT